LCGKRTTTKRSRPPPLARRVPPAGNLAGVGARGGRPSGREDDLKALGLARFWTQATVAEPEQLYPAGDQGRPPDPRLLAWSSEEMQEALRAVQPAEGAGPAAASERLTSKVSSVRSSGGRSGQHDRGSGSRGRDPPGRWPWLSGRLS
jgi:hypothetical protein